MAGASHLVRRQSWLGDSVSLQKRDRDRYREVDHAEPGPSSVSIPPVQPARAYMKSVNELLELFMRQAHLERAMKQPGGARVVEEQELRAVRRKLAAVPDAMKRDVGP